MPILNSMIIWSIQNEAAWNSLQKEGRLIAKAHHQADGWPEAYSWMTDQLVKRVGPAPSKNAVPLWGWHQWQNAEKNKPDLRSVRHHWQPSGNYLLLEFDIPEDEVLLSDFDAWHIPLNEGYLSIDEEADKAFDEKLKQYGWQAGQPKPKALLPEIHKSWELIFDLDTLAEPYWHPTPKKSIQACFWQIRVEQLLAVKPFTSI